MIIEDLLSAEGASESEVLGRAGSDGAEAGAEEG